MGELKAEHRTALEKVHETLQANENALTSDSGKSGNLLTGWVIVASWMTDDDRAWTSRLYMPEMDYHRVLGMLHDGLYGDWDDDDG